MNEWHNECGTVHCWAGWIVNLAGENGRALEEQTDTAFAAMMIFKASNGESITPENFYLTQEDGLNKIKEMAQKST